MSKLRPAGPQLVSFFCPGCKERHTVKIAGTNAWGFNGSNAAPTFTPSVLVRNGHYLNPAKCWCTYNAEHPEDPAPFHCKQCHSFVTDGRIQFLTDCSHELAGQTVELPDFPA